LWAEINISDGATTSLRRPNFRESCHRNCHATLHCFHRLIGSEAVKIAAVAANMSVEVAVNTAEEAANMSAVVAVNTAEEAANSSAAVENTLVVAVANIVARHHCHRYWTTGHSPLACEDPRADVGCLVAHLVDNAAATARSCQLPDQTEALRHSHELVAVDSATARSCQILGQAESLLRSRASVAAVLVTGADSAAV
jgi:hypothetical protein